MAAGPAPVRRSAVGSAPCGSGPAGWVILRRPGQSVPVRSSPWPGGFPEARGVESVACRRDAGRAAGFGFMGLRLRGPTKGSGAPRSGGEDQVPRGFIISKNLMRRDLNPGQRTMLVLVLAPMIEAAAKERQRLSQGRGQKGIPKSEDLKGGQRTVDQMAAIASVAPSTVSQAKKVVETSRTLAAEVMAGTISLNDAHKRGT